MKRTMTRFSHLNAEPDSFGGIDPPAEKLEYVMVNVNGREEHEAVIRNADKCRELGVDQAFETIQYLNRWGGWLSDQQKED